MKKKCYIIAGPNGAGKTTFACEFLPNEAECLNFINADLIAHGLSPFQPEKMAMKAGKIMVQRIDEMIAKGDSFAIETTLSGKGYAKKIKELRSKGYQVILYFLKLPAAEFAIERVKLRVSQGGHHIPQKDIRRRFDRGWPNCLHVHKSIVDSWIVCDTSEQEPVIIEQSEEENEKQNKYAVIGLKALKRASKKVAENAIKNSYKIPIWKNGKIIYEIPSVTTE